MQGSLRACKPPLSCKQEVLLMRRRPPARPCAAHTRSGSRGCCPTLPCCEPPPGQPARGSSRSRGSVTVNAAVRQASKWQQLDGNRLYGAAPSYKHALAAGALLPRCSLYDVARPAPRSLECKLGTSSRRQGGIAIPAAAVAGCRFPCRHYNRRCLCHRPGDGPHASLPNARPSYHAALPTNYSTQQSWVVFGSAAHSSPPISLLPADGVPPAAGGTRPGTEG